MSVARNRGRSVANPRSLETSVDSNGVSVASLHADLTTAEAAEMLGASRPHLVKLLDQGAMPHRLVGSHRRVHLVDVLADRDRQDDQARRALDELTAQAEELGPHDAP